MGNRRRNRLKRAVASLQGISTPQNTISGTVGTIVEGGVPDAPGSSVSHAIDTSTSRNDLSADANNSRPLISQHVPPGSSSKRTGWLFLKQTLATVRDGCDLFLPLKAALVGVVAIMDLIQHVEEAQGGFTELARKVSTLESILSQYGSESDMPPHIRKRLGDITTELNSIKTSIEEKMNRARGKRTVEVFADMQQIEGMFRQLAAIIESFQVDCNASVERNVDDIVTMELLGKLDAIRDAGIDAQDGDVCMEGTRVNLLQHLDDWKVDMDAPRVFWLDRMAGTGKSAIARSFCKGLKQKDLLGGSFFCSLGTARDNVKRIIPTLAASLARHISAYKWTLLEILRKYPDVGHDRLDLQVERLLLIPLRGIPREQWAKMVLVIDALDECSDDKATELMLSELVSASFDIPVKFFVTSRPEKHIRARFQSARDDIHRVLRLHEIENEVINADISHYITRRLNDIRIQQSLSNPSYQFPSNWPSKRHITSLTNCADRLFIYAFTAMKYVQEFPVERLLKLTNVVGTARKSSRPLNKALDTMYTFILDRAMDTERFDEEEIVLMRRILAAILTVREPQRLWDLAILLGVHAKQVRSMLDGLYTVIHIPQEDERGVVSTFHASFGDYMTTAARSGAHYIDSRIGHHDLAHSCIKTMERGLHFNISQCPTSYFANLQQSSPTVPTHLLYACSYWAHHLYSTSEPEPLVADKASTLLERIDNCLHHKFLFWVELFSARRQVQLASNLIRKALTASIIERNKELGEFLRDANDFIISCREVIEESAPHIYLSALPSISPTSHIAQAYWPEFQNTATFHPRGIERHRNTLLHIKGHTSGVTSVAVSPDGTRIASGSWDCTIRVWDARTGEEVTKPLTGHTSGVNSVAFSPDGTLIASGSYDKTIRIWDARTAEEVITPLTGHDGRVNSVVFSPDGTRVVSGSSDCTIRVWDVSTGKEVMEPFAGHTNVITSVVISPDGTRIASGSGDGTVRVWHMPTGKEVTEPLKGHVDRVQSVAFSLDGSKIISGSDDGIIRLWDRKTGEPRAERLKGHTDYVNAVAFAPDGIYIASGSSDQSIRIWDTRTGREVTMLLTGHTRPVTSVVFSPDGAQIISGSWDGTVRVWDARMDEEAIKPLPGHTDHVNSVAFSPDGSRLTSSADDGTIRVWDSRTGEQVVKPLTGHEGTIFSVAFSPDGTQLASGSADETIRLWDAETGEEVAKPLTGHTGTVYSVAFSSDGSQIASGSGDRTIRLWNAATGEEVGEPLTGHQARVWSVALSPNGSLIASGSADNTLRIWDTRAAAEVVEPLRGHTGWVNTVVFSPDGTTVISGSDDKTIRIWSASTGEETIEPLKGHTERIWSLAVSPDGTRVASGSSDGTIRLWHARTGKEVIAPLTGHGSGVTSVAFSPDGTRIASGSFNDTVRIFDATIANPDESRSRREADPHSEHDPSAHPAQSARYTPLTNVRHLYEGASIQDPSVVFSFDRDAGWIKGPNGHLILWIPPEYRKDLYGPRETLVIAPRTVSLDMHRYVHGTEWTNCYTPRSGSSL